MDPNRLGDFGDDAPTAITKIIPGSSSRRFGNDFQSRVASGIHNESIRKLGDANPGVHRDTRSERGRSTSGFARPFRGFGEGLEDGEETRREEWRSSSDEHRSDGETGPTGA